MFTNKMETGLKSLLWKKSTFTIVLFLGTMLLGLTETRNPIRGGIKDRENVYIVNKKIPIPTTDTTIIPSPGKSRSKTEFATRQTLQLRTEVEEDDDSENSSTLDDNSVGRSQTVDIISSSESAEETYLLKNFDVESRWFPKESYAEHLKAREVSAEETKTPTSREKIEIVEKFNAFLPRELEVKENDIEKDGNKTRTNYEQKTLKRTKRSWGDFWYDDEDYGFGDCDYPPCPLWSEWHGSGLCDARCGGGKRLLVRYCNNSNTDEFQGGCDGESTKLEKCNTEPCPLWSEWTPANKCSASCGEGIQKYTRKCTANGRNTRGCVGTNVEFRICSTSNSCPPKWTNWSRFSSCTKTCGPNSIQVRKRLCIVSGRPAVGSKTPCKGRPVQQRRCSGQRLCPKRFSKWTAWSHCDAVTCDATGAQSRSRSCLGTNGEVLPKYKMNCRADQLVEGRECRAESCTKACTLVVADFSGKASSSQMFRTPTPTWSQWTEWNACSVSCGLGGRQTRNRMCFAVQIEETNGTIIVKEDITCEGNSLDERHCHYNIECPHWDSWGRWDGCSKSCGLLGRRRRSRGCAANIYESFNAGEQFESTNILEKTDISASARDDPEGSAESEGSADNRDWENLPRITMYSGGSDLYRKERKLIRRVSLNDHWCEGGTNFSVTVGTCNQHPCPPTWGRWKAWSECSVTCGKGQAQRSRGCVGKGDCHGKKYEFKTCSRAPCWGDWSHYTPCTQSCGSGVRTRSRKCKGTSNKILEFRDCKGPSTENITCNTQGCAKWEEWSSWGNCSAPCDGGNMFRTRKCVQGICRGRKTDIASCNYQPCPYWGLWSTFSCCSVTCGDGVKTKKRMCRHGQPGVTGCEGSTVDTQHCNPGSCNKTVEPPIDSFRCGIKPQNKTTKFVLKIFNGKVSRDHEWPWQVSWQHNTCVAGKYDCRWEHLCGATLLGPKWVVTAGHCIEEWMYRVVHDDPGDSWSVVVGMTKLYQSGERYFIRRVFLHPQYEYKGVPRDDIALLKLRDPVPITDFALPACLPEHHTPSDKDNCFVTGWGNTDTRSTLSSLLRHASLPILDFGECQKLGDVYKNYLNENLHLCAGDVKRTEAADSCRGDSGGPMVCIRPDGKWYLAGITSFSFKNCGTTGHAGIYVPMDKYEDWVKKTIENFSRSGC